VYNLLELSITMSH